ncbi:glycosyltransferase family 2 protein [Lysinibacillus halotolerans]|uniref:Glycosyltransferase family 2 protein n=1 Tax=Lysinibacillus halotolerans TaxID=1368476 RepID=A0A3M8HHG6_9BACI|nr:glycosyltransferase family 2 protein [Lysinibacillus halotolerans]RND01827.1 glycosyltransferase family 2 protein [Lysinibacillus halotolerans]
MAELISIVVPVYNAAPFLHSCLQSIKKQTYPSFEVIMINDGSTDESEFILSKYAQEDSRFLLYNQENHGLGYTRNRGISLSTGKYIYFLDSDDELPKNALQSLIDEIVKYDAEFAVGKVLRYNEERKYVPIRHLEFNLYHSKEVTNLKDKPELLQDSIACNKLWKKDFLVAHQLLFSVGKYYEDLNFTLKAAVLANKIAITTENVYYWRVRNEESASSITQQQMKLKNTLDRLDALEENRLWLEKINAAQSIVEENHLKSLLDVVRLHAIKYTLTDYAERKQWEERVYSFLHKIPPKIANRLPKKEKIIYDMIMSKSFKELELFSQVFTNSETNPLVKQINNTFIVPIGNTKYDITSELKPTMIVTSINYANQWNMEGKLTIPKASSEIQGHVYALGRKSKRESVVGQLKYLPDSDRHNVYPFEEQRFMFQLNSDEFAGEDTYDFYFKLDGNEKVQKPARIRIIHTVNNSSSVVMNGKSFTLYRTVQGNLSLTVNKNSFLKESVKKVLRFMKK